MIVFPRTAQIKSPKALAGLLKACVLREAKINLFLYLTKRIILQHLAPNKRGQLPRRRFFEKVKRALEQICK